MDDPLTWRSMKRCPLPGGGPWLILMDCPARLHNTVHAARGRDRRSTKCVCPRAVWSLAAYRSEEQKRNRERDAQRKRERRASLKAQPEYMRTVRHNMPMPNLRGGRCFTPNGRALMDRVGEAGAASAIKFMCKRCPVYQECKGWVLTAEDPGGAWGGYYAGMSVTERKRIWKAEQEELREVAGTDTVGESASGDSDASSATTGREAGLQSESA